MIKTYKVTGTGRGLGYNSYPAEVEITINFEEDEDPDCFADRLRDKAIKAVKQKRPVTT